MSTTVQTKTTQLNNPGSANGTPPTVEKLEWKSGAFPSRTEAKQQIQEQQKLDTTVLDSGSGKGDSKLPGAHLKKADPKVEEAKRAEDKKLLMATGEKAKEPAKEEPHVEHDEAEKKAKQANAALARSRARDAELKEAKQRLAALEADLPKTKELADLFKDARKDPIGFLNKAGLDLETIAQAAINGGKRPEELVKLEEMEKKLKDRDERDARERQQAEHNARLAQMNNGVAAHFDAVNKTITEDPDKYEFCNLKMQQERIPLVTDTGTTFMVEPAIADAWSIQEHAASELGRVLTPAELADALESYYESEYSALKSTKKMQKLLGLAGDKEAPKANGKKESPTLGGRKMQTGAAAAKGPAKPQRKDYKNERQFMDAIVKWGEEELAFKKSLRAG
jgi:hypothetical protein